MLGQEKVAKERATPGSAAGFARSLPLLAWPGGWLNSPRCGSDNASRLLPANLRCSAPLKGPRKPPATDRPPRHSRESGNPEGGCEVLGAFLDSRLRLKEVPVGRGNDHENSNCCGALPKKAKNKTPAFQRRSVFNLPWEAPSNAGGTGGFGWRCLSRAAASLASHPARRVAQGTRVAGADPGSPSSLATFFLAKQEESMPAVRAENCGGTQQKSGTRERPSLGA